VNLLFHNIDLHDQDGHKLALALDLANRIIEHSNDSILISLAEPIDQPGPRVIDANEIFSK
jgi:hypothetical protein